MELLEESQLNKGEQYLKDLDKQYRIANADIEKEISRWYQRFADNNEISMGEARKLLNSKELNEFKWDVMDYIEYGKKNALNQGWMKELENASAKVHISRLESLKLQMQQQVEVLYGNQLDDIDDLMRKIYSDGYYHTAWEIQKGFNIGYDLQSLNSNQINKVLSRPWSQDKRTFSDRLWTNKQQLIGDLQTNLTQAVITGRKPDELIKGLSNRFQVDRKKAGRLVMTESAAFSSRAQQDAYNALDVERFEIVATLDSHTSEICQDLDGDIFDMKDYEVGVTAPPFHPWCRTVTAPYFDDEFSLGERAARGDDGQTYYVPSNMKYHDWKKSFVDGGSKESLKEIKGNDIINSSLKEVKVEDLSDRLQDTIIQYTDGEYGDICEYSQYLQTGDKQKVSLFTDTKTWIENKLPTISEEAKNNAKEILDVIKNQPSSTSPLCRIERGVSDLVEGDTCTLGIRSASQDMELADKIFASKMNGLEFEHFNGNFTEYVFQNSKGLNISSISKYQDQQEILVAGKYRVIKTELIENIKGGFQDVRMPIKEYFKSNGIDVEQFTSKKGTEMVRYKETGVEKTMTLEKYNTGEITDYVNVKGQFGRKKIYLEVIE
jgi:SPP1 gp7 family putative phage head morphogenesis protein